MRMKIGGFFLAVFIVCAGLPMGSAAGPMDDLTTAVDNLGRSLALHFKALAKAGQLPHDFKPPDWKAGVDDAGASEEKRMEVATKRVEAYTRSLSWLPITMGHQIVKLPVKESRHDRAVKTVAVSLDPDGTIYLGKQKVAASELSSAFERLASGETAVKLVMAPHPQTAYHHIFTVTETARAAGIESIAFKQ